MAHLTLKEIVQDASLLQTQVTVKGWVRSKRNSKSVTFLALNDGSLMANFQAVIDTANTELTQQLESISTGSGLAITGLLVPSHGSEQSVELQVSSIITYGPVGEDYKLQKKGHSLEFLREIAHLRPRTNTFGAVFRIRHHVAFAIHKYFNEKGFFYLHTPILTSSDAEGAGETFVVTTLDLNKVPQVDGAVDFSQDFFARKANLTVSGQLEAELAAMALSKVYTFGPTFRAENSNTTRHLAEFWMIEPEVAFNDLVDNMDLAEDFLKYVIQYALDHCKEDLEFLTKMYDKELLNKLNFVTQNEFIRLTYTEAVEILKASGHPFEYPVEWGTDLQSEHERYLVEKHFTSPVILTNYPKEIKAFYMKLDEDGKTVKAMDILFPGIGEIVGGSQREDDFDKLVGRMHDYGIEPEELWWYLDTRKYGSVPHSGFGLGFDRLVLFITGMGNIRDVIPFPRTPKHIDF